MLARAVRRKARRELPLSLTSSFNQLQLPWLCPAIIKCINQPRTSRHFTSATPPPHLQRRRRRSLQGLGNASRQLATAAEVHTPDALQDFIPFQNVGSRPSISQSRYSGQYEPSRSSLRPFDTQNLVVVDPHFTSESPRFQRAVYAGHSFMTGNVIDLQQSLYACVRVGRYDRAATLVRRLNALLPPDASELVDAHHQYLIGLLESLVLSPSHEKFPAMQKWFELDIRAKNIMPSAPILAIMMKASLHTLQGSRLERTLRRYMSMAEQPSGNILDDVVSSNLFDANEWSKIIRLCPQWYSAPVDDSLDTEPVEPDSSLTLRTETSDIEAENMLSSEVDSVAKLRPVQQKGLGLKALKKSLSSMVAEGAGIIEDFQSLDTNPLHVLQKRLEEDAISSALERWREEAELTKAVRNAGKISDPVLGSFVHSWVQEITALVKEEIQKSDSLDKEKIQELEDLDTFLLGPFLKLVDSEKLSAAALLAFIATYNTTIAASRLENPDMTVTATAYRIGSELTAEIQAESLKNSLLEKRFSLPSTKRQNKLAKLLRRRKPSSVSVEASAPLKTDQGLSEEVVNLELTTATRIKLGAMFLSFIMKVAKLPVAEFDPLTGRKASKLQPMVSRDYKWKSGKAHGTVKIHDELIDRLKREPVGSYIAKNLPMVVEPRKWTSLYDGAYLSTKSTAVRFRDSSKSQQEYAKVAAKRGDMKQVFEGLDVIGRVPWRINADVFQVLAEAWNTGEAIGGLAPESPLPNYPPEPESTDPKVRWRWRNVIKQIENENMGFHSQRCYQNFQLEVARSFLGHTFYCPHNIDFRGRAYPIPPYFNHMGADYVRALFLFAEGRELGETGLKWLKIHLANVYGFDKASLQDREAFAMEHLSDIYDSANNPLGGRRWWLTAEDPWQCLATSIELRNALDSPLPSKYVSHLPVHQDGTCNGLQHYAALGGDVMGATQVNLMPGEKPADVYGAVAALVKEAVSNDAKKGDKTALVLDGKITRKIVKQPVMTNVYGVTFHGAKAQIKKQLVEVLPKESMDNDINIDYLSYYIAKQVFAALAKIFNGAQAIQRWLGDCGARVSQAVTPEQIERIQKRRNKTLPSKKYKKAQLASQKASAAKEDFQFKSTIVWTTPLGMPVVQPYREGRQQLITTNLQQITICEPTASDPVSKRKQLQGFPPNFIHSLDATHMMLSALDCSKAGLQFSAVHDSFWTHACDVPTMGEILRDAFVRMHGEDIVGRLREELTARYAGCFQWSSIPSDCALAQKIKAYRTSRNRPQKSFTISKVRSEPPIDELLEEHERAKLLRSESPEERKMGRMMVTPASLLEQEPDFALSDIAVEDMNSDKPAKESAAEFEAASNFTDIENEMTFEESAPETEATSNTLELGVCQASNKRKERRRTSRPKSRRLYLWTPITFPRNPQKGEFDVQKVKESQYFFS